MNHEQVYTVYCRVCRNVDYEKPEVDNFFAGGFGYKVLIQEGNYIKK